MLLASITGCVSEQPNNETSATPNPINITYTYCLSYNGTSYLTGVIKNVGTWNLLDISLQAEGYAKTRRGSWVMQVHKQELIRHFCLERPPLS
jgi:hypothetical protein